MKKIFLKDRKKYFFIFFILFNASTDLSAQFGFTFGVTWSGPLEVCPGGSVTITADPLPPGNTYQWHMEYYFDGFCGFIDYAIPGATNASITVSESSVYWCIALDQSGQEVGYSQPSVWVTSLSTPVNICHSRPLNFCQPNVFGQPDFTDLVVQGVWQGPSDGIQWQRNGVDIPYANSAFYPADSSGTYRCRVTNNCGFQYTHSIVVNAIPRPLATYTTNGPTTFCPGGSVTFSVAQQTGNTYLWRKNGFTVSTQPVYTATQSGTYIVYVTNPAGCSSTSLPAIVNAQPFASVTASGSVTFCSGASVTLNANSASGFTYQWYKNGNPLNGATSQNYSANSSGSYTVTLTGSCGSATSSPVNVTVNPKPSTVTTVGGPTTFCTGESVTISVNTGTSVTYQWLKSNNPISGATAYSYTATTSGNYKVVKTNSSGCSRTSAATAVTVNPKPAATITANGPTTFCAGGSVTFTANSGTGYTYKWRKNNVPISGATNINYTATTAGSYNVKVTNSFGCYKYSPAQTVTVPCREAQGVSESVFDVKVYPNPSSGDFILEIKNITDEKVSVIVYDIIGKIAFKEENINSQFIIRNSQLNAGVYSAEIINGENKKVLKLIKISEK